MRFMPSHDRFNRPILVVRATYMTTLPLDILKREILLTYEMGRLHIAEMYKKSGDHVGVHRSEAIDRVLQFTLVADLQGLGIRKLVSLDYEGKFEPQNAHALRVVL